jgi:hypothetical protein
MGPYFVPNKPCTTVSARDVDRYDSEVVENATTPYTALSYAKALLASGDVKLRIIVSSCSLSIQIAADTDLLTFSINCTRSIN